MITRNNYLLDIRDRANDCNIVLLNTSGVWSGNNLNIAKNNLYWLYSLDMRMGKNRSNSGFSYIERDNVLYINSYCLNSNYSLNRDYYNVFLDKLKDNYSKIFKNRLLNTDKVGIIIPELDNEDMSYIDTISSEYMGRVVIYRFKSHG